jgi:hypothetical protein
VIPRLTELLAIMLAMALAGNASGHEVRPGYLELRETGVETWHSLWKVPALGEMRLSIRPKYPKKCTPISEPVMFQAAGAYTERMTLRCKGGLAGDVITIEGLSATMTDVLVRSVRADGSVQVARLTASEPSFVYETSPGSLQVVRTYSSLGIEHILLGFDHLLFVLGLLLIVRKPWLLVKTITAFTIAHSLTLAAATFGLLRVSQTPVEAVIALSILFLAGELAKQRDGQIGLMQRFPWVVAFTFGLLHGLGFAGALREVGLPEREIPLALFAFNAGVEVGQLLFIGAVFALIVALRRARTAWPAWTEMIAPYGIGSLAAFWTIQRIASFV